MSFDSQQQRKIMGAFATGVTVASTRIGDETWGMTANGITSLSLDPPLVLLAVQKDAASHGKFKEGGCFALSILTVEQQELSDRFAFKGPKDFSGLDYATGESGAPILADSLGWVDCRITQVLEGGDHDIFIGEILAGQAGNGEPLLYFNGKYRRMVQ
ncbi:MAG TPA: flavin reductase family protein [Pirellulaceae bacterium]|nr:flavin reductase family protein [Pirellulaceae bacterium]